MNTYIIRYKWVQAFLFAILLASCDERFAEINTSPNDVTNIPNEYLFANAVRQTFLSDAVTTLKFGGQYSHIYVGNNDARYMDSYLDHFTSAEYRYFFEQIYYGPIRNINKVLELTGVGGPQENKVRHAIGGIISSVNFLRLTDAFGSIPFKNGGQGQNNILYPEYDSVESIYTEILAQLKNSLSVLQAANPKDAFPGADPLYNNDLSKWVRFANSMRLRMAMRIRFVAPQLATPIINDCLQKPLIEENSQNAKIDCVDSDISELQNPIYQSYNYWKWKVSKLFVDQLKNNGDPRLKVFVQANSNGEYIGIPNGLSDSYFSEWNWNDTSNPASSLVGKAAPVYYMSAAEIWLLRAEAALDGMITGDANALYRKGISKALEQWNVSTDAAVAFMQAPICTLAGSQEQRFGQIATQLWLASMPDTFEAWSSVRRTGYPKIEKRSAPMYQLGVSGGVLPKRLRYPAVESNINRENYEKALKQQGADEITTALWWDVRN